MALDVQPLAIPDVLLITPQRFGDARGFFMQTWQEEVYRAAGVPCRFVQDNFSHSCAGTLRGLHYQLQQPQGKLVFVVQGAVLDVAVDIRRGSPTFGRWVSAVLSAENHQQLFVPPGFAHGFRVLSETVDFFYKCSDFYAPGDEYGIRWNDPALGVQWSDAPLDEARLIFSEKDKVLPFLQDVPESHLPVYVN